MVSDRPEAIGLRGMSIGEPDTQRGWEDGCRSGVETRLPIGNGPDNYRV
jgi:hypothetical protein